jgi:hypothetical protein
VHLAVIYFVSVLILPDTSQPGPVDMRRHYYETRRRFFLLIAVALTLPAIEGTVFYGNPPWEAGWMVWGTLPFALIGATVARSGHAARARPSQLRGRSARTLKERGGPENCAQGGV